MFRLKKEQSQSPRLMKLPEVTGVFFEDSDLHVPKNLEPSLKEAENALKQKDAELTNLQNISLKYKELEKTLYQKDIEVRTANLKAKEKEYAFKQIEADLIILKKSDSAREKEFMDILKKKESEFSSNNLKIKEFEELVKKKDNEFEASLEVITSQEQRLYDAQNELNEMIKENKSLNKQIEDLEEKNYHLESDVEEMNETCESMKEEYEYKLSIKEGKINELTKKLNSKEDKLQQELILDMRRKNEELEKSNSQLSIREKAKSQEMHELQQKNEALEKLNTQLTNQQKSREKDIVDLSKRIEDTENMLNQERTSSQEELCLKNKTCSDLHKDLENLTKNYGESQKIVQNLYQKIQILEDQLNNSCNHKKELIDDFNTIAGENNRLVFELDDKSAALELVQSSKDAAEAQVNELRGQLQNLKKEFDEVYSYKKQANTQHILIQKLERELGNLKKDHKDLKQYYEDLEMENISLESNNNELKLHFQALETDIKNIKQESCNKEELSIKKIKDLERNNYKQRLELEVRDQRIQQLTTDLKDARDGYDVMTVN